MVKTRAAALATDNPLRAAFLACRSNFISAAVFSALLNVLYLAPTLYMLQVYDRVVQSGSVMTLIFLTMVLLATIATLAMLDRVRSRLMVISSAEIDHAIASPVLETLLARRTAKVGRVRQAMREFDGLRQIVSGPAVLALFDAPWAPIYVAVCFLIHPILGAVALIGALSLVGLAILAERMTKTQVKRSTEMSTAAYAAQDGSIYAAEVVRGLGMRDALVRKHMDERRDALSMQLGSANTAGGFSAVTKFVRLSLQSLALGTGAYLAINRLISPGSIFAASLLVSRALAPIEQVLGSWRSLQQARNAYGLIEDLLQGGFDHRDRTLLPPPQGHVQFESVTVVHPAGEALIFHDVSFRASPGEVIALLGPSGAGKTTLLKVIAGLLPPDRGIVRLDAASINDWDQERLAAHIGYVPQDSGLLQGSIRDNISRFQAYAAGGPDPATLDARTVEAARAAGAHELILQLPQGYDTVLGQTGAGLSAGQSQRVALARALFGAPSILVLDEPNAHLDHEGERDLVRILEDNKRRGAVAFVAAQRPGVLAAADKIMLLRNGRLDMFGPRDEVLKRLTAPSPSSADLREQAAASS